MANHGSSSFCPDPLENHLVALPPSLPSLLPSLLKSSLMCFLVFLGLSSDVALACTSSAAEEEVEGPGDGVEWELWVDYSCLLFPR